MKDDAQITHEESIQNTSQSSSSGTTGPGSFQILNLREDEMNGSGHYTKTGSSVDQGADNLEPPQALYTTGGVLPRRGYEPKPSSTWVVDGALEQKGAYMILVPNTTSTGLVHCAVWESGIGTGA